ncbi:mannitol dehydrogenase family protein [Ruegeria sp. 2205SS24-7]|uniref:mannitol dehydrogenase family protein n=1 Tax=Ruegeria discodermiae TaxID=3064389 RepID=UPI0027410A90|nr:mannitol dehydrogenase family protein [Ruegeria sp. 2205SS24-7]MDP5215840.1 mannitol dehydrogenase family protein [Ruegeria sp. 2205SS24-7]
MDELMKDMASSPTGLSLATLAAMPGHIDRPRYDRRDLRPGIVHIGLGNFHRAHQAWYLHRLMQQGEALDWAIIGAGVRPYDAAMREKLIAQDCLTTLLELAPDSRAAEIIGPMIDYLPIEVGHGALIRAMAHPSIRIVSLTVTEGGYFIDGATGGFDVTHPDIQHDAANPDTPKTAFGAMIAALRMRRAANLRPFTAMSCDNLQGNGRILRNLIVGLARLSDPDLARWIDTEGAFPNSMVDCIVPATGPGELTLVRDMGVEDAAPVPHENFRQWVIEDSFAMGRPNWDKVGATFSEDVHAYEMMKIRVLNAGHQVVANAGVLLGVETIAGCLSHPLIKALFRKVQRNEIAPYIAPVPSMEPETYIDLIEQRFANDAIRDTTRRVAFDGSSRHPGFVLPILRDALAAGGPIDGLVLVEALWARMCAGSCEDGTLIEPNDPAWDQLVPVAKRSKDRPQAWLEETGLYGALATDARVVRAFEHWLPLIWQDGVAAALETYTRSPEGA